jgi:hypothetical protein
MCRILDIRLRQDWAGDMLASRAPCPTISGVSPADIPLDQQMVGRLPRGLTRRSTVLRGNGRGAAAAWGRISSLIPRAIGAASFLSLRWCSCRARFSCGDGHSRATAICHRDRDRAEN